MKLSMLPGPSPFNPSSAHAAATSHLFIIVLLLMATIFALVTGLMLCRRQVQEEPPQVFGNTKLEVGWAFAPTILLIIIFGLTVNTISAVDRPHPRHKGR